MTKDEIGQTATKKDYHGTSLSAPECDSLLAVECILRKAVPAVSNIRFDTFGFVAEKGHITALGLSNQELTSLPELWMRSAPVAS